MYKDRRNVPRYSAHLKATLHPQPEGTSVTVTVEDLCVLGCLLEYAPSLGVRQECELTLDWNGRKFRTPAVVAWNSPQGQAGLAFHDTDPASKALLREICSDLRLKPLVRLAEEPKSEE